MICKKYYEVSKLIDEVETTDIFLGYDYGIPYWKEYHLQLCPKCKLKIVRDGEVILWRNIYSNHKGDVKK
jgi:hypothetical protein